MLKFFIPLCLILSIYAPISFSFDGDGQGTENKLVQQPLNYKNLVDKLGDDDYPERAYAQIKLENNFKNLHSPTNYYEVKNLLNRAIKSTDLEIARRAENLLELLKNSPILQNEDRIFINRIINSFALSPNDRILAFGTSGGELCLYDLAQKKQTYSEFISNNQIRSLSFSPRSNLIAIGSWDGFYLKSFSQNEKDIHLTDLFQDNKRTIDSVAFSKEGQMVAYGDTKAVTLQDLFSKEVVNIQYGKYLGQLGFLPKSQGVVASSFHGDSLEFFRLNGKNHPFNTLKTERRISYVFAIHPNEDFIAMGQYPNHISFWNQRSNTFKRIGEIDLHPGKTSFGSEPTRITFSPTGHFLAVGEGGSAVSVWEIASKNLVYRFQQPLRRVTGVLFSSDGNQLFTTGSLGSVFQIDLFRGTIRLEQDEPDQTDNLQGLWNIFAEPQNAGKAYWAMHRFIQIGERAIPFLQERLIPFLSLRARDSASSLFTWNGNQIRVIRALYSLEVLARNSRNARNELRYLASLGDARDNLLVPSEAQKALARLQDLDRKN